MDKQLKKCPLGIQTFEKVISEDLLYVDKTQYIYSLAQNYRYVFLSRPRRFGKSLLASTLHSYFSGKKELFKGLAIERLETEWTEHPVLHFDMSLGKHMGKEQLERFLGERLVFEERKYGIDNPATDINDRFTNLIVAAYEKTGRQAVVLIDEYDAPLLDVVHEDEQLPQLRQVMRNFYSPLKACDPYLRFVFLTGITKFSQMSIFSELNNLTNISMDAEYAGICGITEEELTGQLSDYVDSIADNQGKTHDEVLQQLKKNYDGYHFSWPSPDIFNPFSLLTAFAKRKIGSYWFASGTPTYLIEMMRKFGVAPSQIGPTEAMASAFDAPTERMTSLIPLLYQSGYLTIKDYYEEDNIYVLDIPNKEIRIGLMESLLPSYVQGGFNTGLVTVSKMNRLLRQDDLDGMLRLLQQYLLTIPQCDNTNYEGHYQQLLFVIFSLLGEYVDVEVRTATGRVDMVMQAFGKLYLFELKLNRSAAAAMKQINLNDYPARFSQCGLPIVKVGINFDTATRTLSDWVIE
ncbi:MAG: ATP-binding protein [Bacteroidales bacterium]|nr:ATP-binding protein [Bacteroidales bacterium]